MSSIQLADVLGFWLILSKVQVWFRILINYLLMQLFFNEPVSWLTTFFGAFVLMFEGVANIQLSEHYRLHTTH